MRFALTRSNLRPILDELTLREPVFHRKAFGTSRDDFERATAPHYWEVGASGRRYSRQFILDELEKTPPVDAERSGWQAYDAALQQLGANTYLMTYSLRQIERLSRRATIWRRNSDGWRILYHQGTLAAEEDERRECLAFR